MKASFILPRILIFMLWCPTCFAPPFPFSDHCLVGKPSLYDSSIANIPSFDIDLDGSDFSRWNAVSARYKNDLVAILKSIKELLVPVFGQRFIKFLDWSLSDLDGRFPQPYAAELKGIANVTGLPLGEVVLYNIFYEVFTVCTSIVAQDPQDTIYHVRNMDFGLFMGWNVTTHDWIITEKLRKIVYNANFIKNGKILYKAAMFAGYIGIYTAVKPNAFAVTINERFKIDGGYRGIYDWLVKKSKASWTSWMVREVLEKANDYDDAVRKLSSVEVIAPLYIIVSGTKSGEGQIIVRSRNKTDGVVKLDLENTVDGWFVLQTNTDPWDRPAFFDNRRDPGRRCMKSLGRQKVGPESLFQVLSSPTTLNKLTVFSSLIHTAQGRLETHIQKCPDPCWPW